LFQSLLSKWVNLHRYTKDSDPDDPDIFASFLNDLFDEIDRPVGLYKLNAVDPQLETAWVNP
jgi:hypothetical protein